jgi:SAM-dependent methyltransferase
VSAVDETIVLRREDGHATPLDVTQWSARADAVERRQLESVDGPVLDIGCGPGRLVVALAERGVPALGVDASPAAVGQAHERRASALVRSVFDAVPGAGRWRTALLFDGNIGIGGDPSRLLRRVAELLGPEGTALVETGPPDQDLGRFPARVERGQEATPWFPWAHVGSAALASIADSCGFDPVATDQDAGRWFVRLRRSRP